MNSLPKLALTMGDPAGVGPELAVRAAVDKKLAEFAEITVYGCPEILAEAARRFLGDSSSGDFSFNVKAIGDLRISQIPIGKTDADCGVAARDAVIVAVEDALARTVDGIVTCPMNKAAVNLAGIPFTGHTELVAEICGSRDYAMMQSAGPLRVIFATTHVSLAEVPGILTKERIIKVARLLLAEIREEGVPHPRLAMAALNPHAGEDGNMGREEIDILLPALAELRGEGHEIDGPFPPDTLFISRTLERYDGIISMYHDQGHIPFKMLAFDRGVNSTLGLPIIRTSVDHGTAFDIAWQGKANPGSLLAAIRLAAKRAVFHRGNPEF